MVLINFNCLQKLDIFGFAVTFRIMQAKSHKTKIGGFFTLIITSIIIYQLITLTQYVYEQNSPNVVQQQNYIQNQELFKINPKSFSIAFGLQDSLGNSFIEEKVYYLLVQQQSNVRVLNNQTGFYEFKTQFREIKYSPCQPENFQVEEIKEYFLKLPLSQMYCIDLSEQDISIQGEFTELIFQQLLISVFECTDSGACADPTYRQQKLNKARFGIYTSDDLIQMTEKNRPYKPIGKNLFWNISPNLEQELRYQIINNYIYSDVGIIRSDIEKVRVVSYSSDKQSIFSRQSSRILKFYLLYEKNKENVYIRKYMKLDQAFSQIGGTFNILVAIGCFICMPISQLELNRKVLNTIFDIDSDNLNIANSEKKGKKSQIKKSQSVKSSENDKQKSNQQQNQTNLSNSKLQQLDPIEEQPKFKKINNLKEKIQKRCQQRENEQTEQVSQKLKLKFSDYFLNYFSLCRRKNDKKSQIIKFGTDIIYSHIDIFNIIHKLLEVEKLKHLLLNDRQLMLFDYLPKPTLKLSEIPKQNSAKSSDKNKEDMKTSFSTSFINKSNKQNQEQSLNQQNMNYDQDFIITAQKKNEEKQSDAIKAYYMITTERKKSKIDQKLIHMLDSKFIQKYKQTISKKSFFDDYFFNRNQNNSIGNNVQLSMLNEKLPKDIISPQYSSYKNSNLDFQLISMNDSTTKPLENNMTTQNLPYLLTNNNENSKFFNPNRKIQIQTEEIDIDFPTDNPNLIINYSSNKNQCELKQKI